MTASSRSRAPAEQTLKTLMGEFDFIFVDANKDGLPACYVKTVLDQKLLSPNGMLPFVALCNTNADRKSLRPRPHCRRRLRNVAQRPRSALLAWLRPGTGQV